MIPCNKGRAEAPEGHQGGRAVGTEQRGCGHGAVAAGPHRQAQQDTTAEQSAHTLQRRRWGCWFVNIGLVWLGGLDCLDCHSVGRHVRADAGLHDHIGGIPDGGGIVSAAPGPLGRSLQLAKRRLLQAEHHYCGLHASRGGRRCVGAGGHLPEAHHLRSSIFAKPVVLSGNVN